jgi:hypothetical protein
MSLMSPSRAVVPVTALGGFVTVGATDFSDPDGIGRVAVGGQGDRTR